MRTILVTGGCGFIGSHLCAALRRRGDHVRVLDDLSTGRRDNLPEGATLQVGDVADRDTVRAAVEGIDGCFHLAAIASVERGVEDWLGTHRANLTGSIALFDALRGSGNLRAPVVYASSAAAYGTPAALPIEEDAEKRPLSAYGADKYACELHARVAGHVHGIPSFGLRFFNVYGPRQDPRSPYSGVISVFCDRLRRGAPVRVFGDGRQTRDFVYVDDVVAALIAAAERCTPEAPVLNVCTGRPTSVLELAETIAALAAQPLRIDHQPPRRGEIRHSLGSVTRLHASLGADAPTPLREGLARTLAWMKAEG